MYADELYLRLHHTEAPVLHRHIIADEIIAVIHILCVVCCDIRLRYCFRQYQTLRAASAQQFQILLLRNWYCFTLNLLCLGNIVCIHIHFISVKVGRLIAVTICGAFAFISLTLTEDIGEVLLDAAVLSIAERQQIAVCVGEDNMRIIILHDAAVSTLGEVEYHAVLLPGGFHQPDIRCATQLLTNGVYPFHEIFIGNLQRCCLLPTTTGNSAEG